VAPPPSRADSRPSGSGGLALTARGLLDLAAAQAPGANVYILDPSAHERAYALQVRVPHALGQVVRVAHGVAGHRALAASMTTLSHVSLLGKAPPTLRCGREEGVRRKDGAHYQARARL